MTSTPPLTHPAGTTGGQEPHHLALHPIDPATGIPGTPTRVPVGKNPNWVEIVDLP